MQRAMPTKKIVHMQLFISSARQCLITFSMDTVCTILHCALVGRARWALLFVWLRTHFSMTVSLTIVRVKPDECTRLVRLILILAKCVSNMYLMLTAQLISRREFVCVCARFFVQNFRSSCSNHDRKAEKNAHFTNQESQRVLIICKLF